MNIRTLFYTIYIVSGFVCVQSAVAQKYSFIQEDVIKVPGVLNDAQVLGLSAAERNTTRSYYEGAGRALQVISVGASPGKKDLVKPYVYDNLGRQVKGYLPYVAQDGSGFFRNNALTEQTGFYSMAPSQKVAPDASPFSERVFENSPLQRVLQMGSVGAGFQPGQRYKSVTYRTNLATETIRRWNADGSIATSFAAGTLQVVNTTDEEGSQTVVYNDNSGRPILKKELLNPVGPIWSETYYVYDDAGQLRYVVPPKAVVAMNTAGNYSLSLPALTGLLFIYVYDEKGRQVERTAPGGGVLYMIYDPFDRLVLAQDANLRAKNRWNYIKYNSRNIPISQGLYLSSATRLAMQGYVSGQDYSGVNGFEERNSLPANSYYTSRSFPNVNIEPLSFSYYDDYDLDGNGVADYNYKVQGLAGEATAVPYAHSRVTMVRKRTLGSGLANIWLTSVIFYDNKGNLVQTQSNNQLNTTVSSSTTVVSDFVGKTLKTKSIQAASVNTTVLAEYSYDHRGRLKTVDESYNGAVAIRVATYEYNELGQLVDKKLHSTNNGASYLQSLDYRYNIRGQLSSINNSTLNVDDKNDDADDLFGMEILYDKTDSSVGNTGYYSGLISAVKWKVKAPGLSTLNERKYVFSYDKQKQLKSAIYADRSGTTSAWVNSGGFDEKNITYDLNGNILTLQRNAIVSGAIVGIDDLTYSYDGNRLTNVTDGSGGSHGIYGFKNLTGSVVPYTYDANGNLQTDTKKGLKLDYNDLNRTDKITITTAVGRYISYTYDAGGALIRKQAFDNNTLVKTTDYISGFVYENNVLQYFGMAEGRVRNASGVLTSEYMIKDHQGNVRVSFEKQGNVAVVRQENSYYPFGLVMPGSVRPSSENKQLYNGGSEWQNDFSDLPDLYQTFYRNYDPALGRFISVDVQAEASVNMTVYHYALNNPLFYNDPLGDKAGGSSEPMGPYFDFYVNFVNKANYGDLYVNDGDGFFKNRSGDLGFRYSSETAVGEKGSYVGEGTVYQKYTLTESLNGVTVILYNKNSYLEAYMNMQKQIEDANRAREGKQQIGGDDWLSNSSKNNWFYGAVALSLENTSGSFRFGTANQSFSMKYYGNGWGGNQYAKTFNISRLGKLAGYSSVGIGVALDIKGVINYYDNPNSINAVHPGKAGLNLGMSTYGIVIGGPGALLYFGVDAFHPGGWQGFTKGLGDTSVELQQHYGPGFRLVPFGPK